MTAVRGVLSRPGGVRRATSLFAALSATLLTITIGINAAPAFATNYPSWADLQAAKANTANAQKAVSQIQAAISSLQSQVTQAQNVAAQKQAEYNTAKQKLDEATTAANALQAQADQSKQDADQAGKNAAQVVSQMFRNSGTNYTLTLLLETNSENADQLLSKLAALNQVVERANESYTRATVAARTAKALTAQAAKAKEVRTGLETAANQSLSAAQDAQATLQSALASQQEKGFELDQQLAYMQNAEAATADAYEEGVRERARLAAAQTQGGSLPGGWIDTSTGWANPAQGGLSDGFGPRPVICTSGGCTSSFHSGQDIAASCGTTIYAAHEGLVVSASYQGTWGNYIKIDHSGGIYTGYAHIRNGGYLVGVGDYVQAGQPIAYVGATGAATGCHLHFEVYNSVSNRIDPLAFMRDHGVALG